MSITTGTLPGVRIVDMPDLGTFTADSSLVGERLGSGRFGASGLSGYFLSLNAGGNVKGKVDFYATDWFTPLCAGPQYRSTLYVLSPDGKNAITGAAQTVGSADYPDAIGIQGFGFNNLPASPTTAAWAGYFEARQYPGATSYTHGIEIDIANVSGVAATECSPYTLTYPFSVGLSMQSGADVAHDSPALTASHASMAFYVGDNGARFQNGLMFKSTALVGTDGAGAGFGNAIGMAAGHKISWYLPTGGGEGSAITSIQTTGASLDLFFDNDIAYFREAALGTLQIGARAGSPALGETVLLLRVHNTAGTTAVAVTLGPPDSAGSGFRTLRVPN
jgi:hypothetical protein